jgi:hypothetical protein
MSEKPDEGTVIINSNGESDYVSFENDMIDYIAASDGLDPSGDSLDRRPLTANLKIMSSAPLMIVTLSDHPDAGAKLESNGNRKYVNDSQVIDTLDGMHCTPAGRSTRARLPAFAEHKINGKARIYVDLSESW